jgi:hypothetical protein
MITLETLLRRHRQLATTLFSLEWRNDAIWNATVEERLLTHRRSASYFSIDRCRSRFTNIEVDAAVMRVLDNDVLGVEIAVRAGVRPGRVVLDLGDLIAARAFVVVSTSNAPMTAAMDPSHALPTLAGLVGHPDAASRNGSHTSRVIVREPSTCGRHPDRSPMRSHSRDRRGPDAW